MHMPSLFMPFIPARAKFHPAVQIPGSEPSDPKTGGAAADRAAPGAAAAATMTVKPRVTGAERRTVQLAGGVTAQGDLVRSLPDGRLVLDLNGRQVTGREIPRSTRRLSA